MAPRKRSLRPVQIVLTEDDLAAIIAETARGVRSASPAPGDLAEGGLSSGWGGVPIPVVPGALPGSGGTGGFASIGDRVWRDSRPAPGAVGEAIERILRETALEGGEMEEE
jgi:hypothetical protein